MLNADDSPGEKVERSVWDYRPDNIDWQARRLGTIVPDIDVEHLGDAMFERIGRALLTHSIIVLKRQMLSPQKQVEFTERFGPTFITQHRDYALKQVQPVLVLSNIKEAGKPIGLVANETGWHTDGSALERPFGITVLHAIEVPPTGGGTKYADMYQAYDALSPEDKRRYEVIKVCHRQIYRYGTNQNTVKAEDPIHPLVITHPQTGRRALYTGEKESACALGVEPEDGVAFMRRLIDFATQPRFVYAHQWEVDDVVIWDNRVLLHSVTPFDVENHRRLLHRTGTYGNRPQL